MKVEHRTKTKLFEISVYIGKHNYAQFGDRTLTIEKGREGEETGLG